MGKKIHKKDGYAEWEALKYEHPIASREFILEIIKERGRPINHTQLAAELDLKTVSEEEALRRRLLAMVRDGQLLKNRQGAFGLIDKMELIPGYVVGHKEGYGFVVPDSGEKDLFLNAKQMRGVFPDDRVLARVSGVDYRGREEAVIVEVIERNTQQVVGRFHSESDVFFVEPSNSRISQTIFIPPEGKQTAKAGQMVVVEITTQPTITTKALGKVIEILGDHMAPGMEIDVAIRNHELPFHWPDEVLQEASSFSKIVSKEAIKERRDCRHIPFVTIDGEDAKDFDDAVFCEKRPAGGWTLYVAIADVSFYVLPGTALDREAYHRGNSVYFPGRVIPMLPEVLSNELCSLKPNVDRLTMVCEMNVASSGKITHYEFYEAVICSKARLTYTNVYDMVVQNKVELQKEHAALFPHLQELFSLYQVLYAHRHERGAIDFELPETKIMFGEGRKIERIVPLKRNDAHRLIEECMLCANICAALFLIKNKYPALFRVHHGPSPEKLIDLRRFLGELSLTLPGKDIPKPEDYARLLEKIRSRPDAHLIQTVLLRSLSQAVYSPENKGHFGLAFEAYTHFTSPIRRYPDLLVHRAIRHVVNQHRTSEEHTLLEKQGEHCSMTERRADDATREAIDWLKCEYM